jgi:hypothetical protein
MILLRKIRNVKLFWIWRISQTPYAWELDKISVAEDYSVTTADGKQDEFSVTKDFLVTAAPKK